MRERRKFNDEYRTEVVGLIVSGRQTRNDICKRLELGESMVARWCRVESFGGHPRAFVQGSDWQPGQEHTPPKKPKNATEHIKLPQKFFPAAQGHTLNLEEKLMVVAFAYATDRSVNQLVKDIGKGSGQIRVWLQDEELGGSMAKYKERWGKDVSPDRKRPQGNSPGVQQLGAGTVDPGSGLPTRPAPSPTVWQLSPEAAPAKPVVTGHACPNCHHPLDLSDVNRGAPNHVEP